MKMERIIQNWRLPHEHKGHLATLAVGWRAGDPGYRIEYVCNCNKGVWNLGFVDPSIIGTRVWDMHSRKY